MQKKLLIWDFDGVIVDSFEIGFKVNLEEPVPAPTREDYRSLFMGNVYDHDVVKQSISKTGGSDTAFMDRYLAEMINLEPLPGMKELVTDLASSGVIQAIVSSTRTSNIEYFLSAHGMRDLFDDVLGSDVERSKVKKFKMLSEKYSVPLTEALFVTDTLGDLKEAEHVEMPAIAVSWGFHLNEHLEQGKSIALVHTVNKLKEVIEQKLFEVNP